MTYFDKCSGILYNYWKKKNKSDTVAYLLKFEISKYATLVVKPKDFRDLWYYEYSTFKLGMNRPSNIYIYSYIYAI